MDTLRYFAVFGLLGFVIGVICSVIVEDVESREREWFDAPDKWIYRNPFV